jgi:SulP family sulfate permease
MFPQYYPIWLSRLFPPLVWWSRVNRSSFRADLIAGVSGAVIVLPQGVAFATIAGMPPEYGLYAGMVPAIVAALFGSSWHLVSGPTTAASVVLLSSLSTFAVPGTPEYVQLALTLTFMVGILQLAMGLAGMGILVNFISHSVLAGFTAGAAILIAAKQLKNFFGVELPGGGHVHDIVGSFLGQVSEINPYVTAVAVSTLLCGIAIKLWVPKAPYLIIAMLFGTTVALVLNLVFGDGNTHIATVGALPATLPPLSAPSLSLQVVRDLAPATLAVALFALTEAVSIGRSIAMKSGQHVNANQEFVGQGLSNVIGSWFSGYVATGSFNRSAMNYQAGARTPLAAMFAGGFLIVTVLLVAPYASYLPNAAMAGILFLVAWRLIDLKHIVYILRSSWSETSVLAITFFGALFLELEFAIFAGVMLSLVLYLNRTSNPAVHSRVPDPNDPKRKFTTDPGLPECPQMKMVRVDGSLFFGAVPNVQRALRVLRERTPGQKYLMLLGGGINFIDLSGAEFLANEARARKAEGGGFFLYRAKRQVLAALERTRHIDAIGRENISNSKTSLIATAFSQLDRSVCERCTKRIFRECASVPKVTSQDVTAEPIDETHRADAKG